MRLHLQTKTTLIIAALVLAVLIISGWFFYYAASQALNTEMDERLTAMARTSAAQLDGQYVEVLQPGSEDTRLYENLQRRLQAMCNAAEARAIYVFDLEGKSLLDTRMDMRIGSHYRFLEADQVHIEQAKAGVAAASVGFHGEDEAFYKTAYAPVMNAGGNIVAILGIDASVLFLGTLDDMQRNMILTGVLGMFFAAALSFVFARSIAVPIKRLSQAAQHIEEGEFDIQVDARSGDEVGVLASTFNQMSHAIRAREYRLSRLAEELRQMSAGLAHEVRNPLNGMRLYLGLLKRRLVHDPASGQFIGTIEDELQSLNQIVTEFLNFARPAPLQCGPINLHDVLDSVLALFVTELAQCKVDVEVHGLESLPVIEADGDQLRWSLTNLIKNAVEAMSDGGKLLIRGYLESGAETVQIELSDTGYGMSAKTVERAFDAFFTTKDTGTGLGLAIVKRLVERHSGTIECQSTEGEGTLFRIVLPITQQETGDNAYELDSDCRRP